MRIDGTRLRYFVGMVVDALGSGIFLPLSLIYFHHVTGLPFDQVGLVVTGGALLGLAGNPLGGILVDRYGSRAVLVVGYLVRAAGFLLYTVVSTRAEMLAAVTLVAFGDRSFPAAVQAFVSEISRGGDRDRLIAAQRSIRNAGLGAGGLLASAILAIGTTGAYHAIVFADAASFVIAAVLIGGIPVRAPARRSRDEGVRPGGYRDVVADRTFLLLTVNNVPTAFGYMALSVAMPVYITQHLHLSASWVGAMYAVNTIGIAVAQLPATRLLLHVRRTRAAAAGGAVFVLAFTLFSLTGSLGGGAATLVGLVAGTVLYTAAELAHGATATALSVNAAPDILRGRYLAFYQFSWAIPTALAPLVLTGLSSVSPVLMWLVLAAGAGVSGLGMLRLEPRLPDGAVHPSRGTGRPAGDVLGPPDGQAPAPTPSHGGRTP